MKFSGALWIGEPFILIDELWLWEPCTRTMSAPPPKESPLNLHWNRTIINHLDGHYYTWVIKGAVGPEYMHFTSSLTAKMYFNKIFTEKGVDSANRWRFKPFSLTWLSVFWVFFLVLLPSCTVPLKKHDTRLPVLTCHVLETGSRWQEVKFDMDLTWRGTSCMQTIIRVRPKVRLLVRQDYGCTIDSRNV